MVILVLEVEYDFPKPIDYRISVEMNVYRIWPELSLYNDSICFIYAGAFSEYSFYDRPIHSIVQEINTEYENGRRNFMFECLHEGVVTAFILKIHQVIMKLNNPNIKCFYLSGDLDAVQSYNNICAKFKLPSAHITILCCHALEQVATNFLPYEYEYIPGIRGKKFLCFNKVERQHRIDLLEAMLAADLVKDSYYSFAGSAPGSLPGSFAIIEQHSKMYSSYSYNNIMSIKDDLPLILNVSPSRPNPCDLQVEDYEYFQNSYFSVVTETLFFDHNKQKIYKPYCHLLATEPGCFPTEKIYKCFAMKHPYIMLGTKGIVAALNKRGYKSFSPFIDESYDNIDDDDERLAAVVTEIKRLCALPDSDLIKFTEFAKDIVEHNYNQLFNTTDFRVTKDADKLLI